MEYSGKEFEQKINYLRLNIAKGYTQVVIEFRSHCFDGLASYVVEVIFYGKFLLEW